jgi:hypothetical protein
MFGCALLSKPTALPLVVLLLVLDYWPLRRRFTRSTLMEKVPFLVVGVLSAVVTVISQARAGQEGTTQVMNLIHLPMVMGYCITFYLFKMVWPVGLVADYPAPQPLSLLNTHVLLSVLVAAGILGATLISTRRTRAAAAGAMFFVVAIFPSLGVIRYTSSIAANRSMYLPMLGLLLPLAWGLSQLWNMSIRAVKVSGVRVMLIGVVSILATGSVAVVRSYESHWRDSVTLLRYYLTQSPKDWKLHTRLGNEWIQRGDYPSAIAEFREAARLNPNWAENHLNLGRALFTVGQYPEAKRAFSMALQRTPADFRGHILMGLTLARQKDLDGALAEFRTAAQLAPTKAAAHFNMANILAQQGNWVEAAEEYRQTLRLDPMNGAAQRALQAIASKQP